MVLAWLWDIFSSKKDGGFWRGKGDSAGRQTLSCGFKVLISILWFSEVDLSCHTSFHPRILFVASKEHYWLLPSVLCAKSPRSLSAGLLQSQAAPACFVCNFCLPGCQDLHFPSVSFRRIHLDGSPGTELGSSLLVSGQTCWVSPGRDVLLPFTHTPGVLLMFPGGHSLG